MKTVRLPLYENGECVPGYLEMDVALWLPTNPLLQARHARIITPEAEIEMLDRIISGLPAEVPDDRQPEDVWVRVPGFTNYEINQHGIVRSRFTKKVIEPTDFGRGQFVHIHKSDGKPVDISVELLLRKAFDV